MLRVPRFLNDPPPDHVFELSEEGVAYVRQAAVPEVRFAPLSPGTIAPTPLHDNVQQPGALAEAVRACVPVKDARRHRRAVLVLPDYAARTAVLDFDTLPKEPAERAALVRFRLKKTVPFDIETATVGYHVQPIAPGAPRFDVVAVAVAREIVGGYEEPFRAAGLHPGLVTTSVLAMVDLLPTSGVVVAAKLTGLHLTVTVSQDGRLRLVRCVELPTVGTDDILQVLFPTLAYAEDELGQPAAMLVACGLPHADWEGELGLPLNALRSRHGVPSPADAGLYGYLEEAA